jgi:dTDP-4-dehydrorhamnose 3,5-epimerase
MRFLETPIAGAFIIDPEPSEDGRGFFARIFDAAELAKRGLVTSFPQWSISYNAKRGTLRGLHYQIAPHEEAKIVRCTRGAAHDVIVSLRDGVWFAIELSAENRRALYIPAGVAHGFQTLADATEMGYFISTEYAPASARGLRWNDPALAIEWPVADPILSERDRSFPDFER